MAQLNISKPVGDPQADGSPSPNMFGDVLIVQHLLNQSPGPGKPNPPLTEDGAARPEFIAAIRAYESFRGPVDGRIDPGDATMVALNAVALSEFEGITDEMEIWSNILRHNRDWNFTRGDYKTLTDMAGLSLRFDPSSIWLPNELKTRLLILLDSLLKPSQSPSNTWGVSTLDWYHIHLGLWSGIENEPVSAASKAWKESADSVYTSLVRERLPFVVGGGLTVEKIPFYRASYAAWVLRPEVAILLNSYADLPQAVMIHHTFESTAWRPYMKESDKRRHRMVDKDHNILIPEYRTHEALNAALTRSEFYCEGMIQINFLIDKSGVIHPVLGILPELCLVTGLSYDELAPRAGILGDPFEKR